MNEKGAARAFIILVLIILIFIAFLGIGAFIGKSEGFQNYLDNYTANKEEMEREIWENASDAEKEQARAVVDTAFERVEARKIAEIEKDGTQKVLSLPSFWSGSIEDENQACTVNLPSDFYQKVEEFKQLIIEGEAGYKKLIEAFPNCYRWVGSNFYFEYKSTECSNIREKHNYYYGDLYLRGSIDGREYVETYCDRFAL